MHSGSFQSLRANLHLPLEGALVAGYSPTSWREWFLTRSTAMAYALSRAHVCPLSSEQNTRMGQGWSGMQEEWWALYRWGCWDSEKFCDFAKGAGGIGDRDDDLPSLSTVLTGHYLPDLPVLLHPGLLSSCQPLVCPIPITRPARVQRTAFPYTRVAWNLSPAASCQGSLTQEKEKESLSIEYKLWPGTIISPNTHDSLQRWKPFILYE